MKKCSICKIGKGLKEFNKNRNKKDGRQSKCRQCSKSLGRLYYRNNKEYFKERKDVYLERNRKFVFESLKGKSCADCGEDDIIVLEHDHLEDKRDSVSKMVNNKLSLETIQKEIDKCEVRCANCHRRKTAHDFKYYRTGVW